MICVGAPPGVACERTESGAGSSGDRLQAAIDYAETTTTDDVIRLAAGTYTRNATFDYNPPAGRGSLEIRGSALADVMLSNTSSSVTDSETVEGRTASGPLTIRDLTVVGPPNAPASLGVELGKTGSLIERVRFMLPAGGGTATGAFQSAIFARASATVRDTTIEGFTGGITTELQGGVSPVLTVERTSIDVTGVGVVGEPGGSPGSQGGATLRRVTIRTAGGDALRAVGTTTVLNSVIDASSVTGVAGGNAAVVAGCGTTSLEFTTVRSSASAGLEATCASGAATLSVDKSVLAPGTTVRAAAGGSVSLSRSRWDGPVSAGVTTVGGSGMTTETPQFVSATNLALKAVPSPLIDAVPGLSPGGLDVAGDERVFDGDGTGGAQADLGAYELQSVVATPTPGPTPTPTPSPTPAPSPTPTPTPTPEPPPTPTPTDPPKPPPSRPDPTPTPSSAPPPLDPFGPSLGAYAGAQLTGGRIRLDRSGRATLRVSCAAATTVGSCLGRVQLVRITGKGKGLRTTVLGSKKVTLRSGRQKAPVTVTLSAAAKRLVRGAGLKVTIRAITRDGRPGAADVVTTKPVTLQPAARR